MLRAAEEGAAGEKVPSASSFERVGQMASDACLEQ
jgi:hypothetical protein